MCALDAFLRLPTRAEGYRKRYRDHDLAPANPRLCLLKSKCLIAVLEVKGGKALRL